MECECITVEQLQQALCIGKRQTYELLAAKQIPSFRTGKRKISILKKDVLDYIEKRKKIEGRRYV